MLFSFLFRFEDEHDHHDKEDGHGHAQQDAQQDLSDEPETERFEEKQCEVVDEHHEQRIAEEPKPSQLTEVRLGDVFKLLVARNQLDDGRSAESHQGGGTGVKSRRARKQIDGQTYGKTQHQELPFLGTKWQQHDENQIDIRMYIPSKTDMVDDQHLKKHEHDETDDL